MLSLKSIASYDSYASKYPRVTEEGSEGKSYSGYFRYIAVCSKCPEEDRIAGVDEEELRRAVDHGESSRTPLGRLSEHFSGYRRK